MMNCMPTPASGPSEAYCFRGKAFGLEFSGLRGVLLSISTRRVQNYGGDGEGGKNSSRQALRKTQNEVAKLLAVACCA